MMGACPVLLEAEPDSPVEASRALLSSLLFFFSWLRWVRISCFLLISSSSWACSLRASASTRFFPYLHWSASAAGGGSAGSPPQEQPQSADLPALLSTPATPRFTCFFTSTFCFHGTPLVDPLDPFS